MRGDPLRRRDGWRRSGHPLKELTSRAAEVTEQGLVSTGLAATCCRPVSGPAFAAAREQLAVAIAPRVSLVHWEWDLHGQQWALLTSHSLPPLATAAARIEHTLSQRGFGGLQSWSVFALHDAAAREVHLVYDHRQRGFYPFGPRAGHTRDDDAEQHAQHILSRLLPVVADPAQWVPLWDSPLVAVT